MDYISFLQKVWPLPADFSGWLP